MSARRLRRVAPGGLRLLGYGGPVEPVSGRDSHEAANAGRAGNGRRDDGKAMSSVQHHCKVCCPPHPGPLLVRTAWTGLWERKVPAPRPPISHQSVNAALLGRTRSPTATASRVLADDLLHLPDAHPGAASRHQPRHPQPFGARSPTPRSRSTRSAARPKRGDPDDVRGVRDRGSRRRRPGGERTRASRHQLSTPSSKLVTSAGLSPSSRRAPPGDRCRVMDSPNLRDQWITSRFPLAIRSVPVASTRRISALLRGHPGSTTTAS